MIKKNMSFALFVTVWLSILIILFCSNKIEAADKRRYWNGYYFYTTGFDCWGGKTIDWEYNGSAYSDNVKSAVQKWNSATKEITYGKTSTIFRKDTWDTICDVTISDSNDNDGNNAYIKINGFGFGNMKLNKYYMKDYNSSMKTAIVMHEFGHAIGLGDDERVSDYIMYGYDPEVTELTMHDKQALTYVLQFVISYK